MNAYTIIHVVKELVTGKLRFAQKETVKARVAICSDCEVRNTKLNICTACGCQLTLKVRLKDAQCPMELW